MTPKKEALELLEKYRAATTYQYQEYAGAHPSTYEMSKEDLQACALICIDKILELLPNTVNTFEIHYKKVKEELLNM